ncbi:dihydrolipoamide acetyltransferase family protein [Isoptericola halotolerans]|uniref:Dihydrolipoamide acetyltransferase component of pyruvate dehydrogenase complex n=1 Tax=Isoptericola halotolerans TaxID=300560 RepID=A0ABX1ZYQ3_9MICO|nr:dihydrolipoamide acetyltransferase family protein [Isoptericola halotolerans]NOV95740.1 pyruvate dehydrogenase E2 component (dihydrolipoamide acetyltransferase) [Isoptericola halotolerans]
MSNQRFPLPDVGEGLTEAEIVEWKVAVGDTVAVNDVLVEIETAKSLVELPSPFAGTVVALLAEEGTTVDVGTPIIEVGSADAVASPPSGAAAPASDAATPAGAEGSGSVLVGYGTAAAAGGARRRRRSAASAPAAAAPASAPAPVPAPVPAAPEKQPGIAKPMVSVPADVGASGAAPSGTTPATRVRVLAKPPVRKLANDLGVDLASVQPTGPGGIVTREDVVARADAAAPQALATYPDDDQPWLASGSVTNDGRQTRVPVKSVRKRTAEAMVASAFTAPHVTVFRTVDVTKTMKLVERLKADRDFADVRVTPLLIAAKAVLLAIKRHPEINASWDDEAREIVYKHYVNLGIAAATPRGLVVPNVKDAHRHELLPLAQALGELTATARAGRTSPADMSDGTFTITNVGVFGIDTGTPILNPGEAGIFAFGAIRQQPWVHQGKVKPRWVTQLALSFDHRLVDGELGSRFLSDVARVLEDPARGLVWG